MAFLKNKVVVITGASSGIGAATAMVFAQEGCALVITARRLEKLEILKQNIVSLGVPCLVVQTDVTQLKDVKKLFSLVEKQFGHIDILVNNAGIGRNALLL